MTGIAGFRVIAHDLAATLANVSGEIKVRPTLVVPGGKLTVTAKFVICNLPLAGCAGCVWAPKGTMRGIEMMMPTVKFIPFESTPPTVTTTLPEVAPVGTVTVIEVGFQPAVTTVAVVPLNFTVLVPWVAPKFAPVIVTSAPTGAVEGDKLPMEGAPNAAGAIASNKNVTTDNIRG